MIVKTRETLRRKDEDRRFPFFLSSSQRTFVVSEKLVILGVSCFLSNVGGRACDLKFDTIHLTNACFYVLNYFTEFDNVAFVYRCQLLCSRDVY